MTTRKFDAKQLREEWGMPYDPPPGGAIVSKKMVDRGRWSIHYELIFRLPDQPENEAWRVSYSDGATENQDESPWQYDDEVVATLVRAVEKTITVWEEDKK